MTRNRSGKSIDATGENINHSAPVEHENRDDVV